MFTWDWACKHTVFFTLRASQAAQEDRQHRKTGSTGNRQHREQAAPEHIAQFVHMAHSFTTRAFCTICSQWHAAHSLRASCLP